MPSTRFLDPLDRTLEILFGLIMVLVFTASVDIAGSGRESIREMLIAAVGCNLAWGVVDAVMYLMATFAERSRGLVTLTAIRTARAPEDAHRLVADLLPPGLAHLLGESEFEAVRRRLTTTTTTPSGRLRYDDYMAASGVFLLVSLTTLPVILPFVFMHDVGPALRVSQGIGALLLFLVGWSLGAHSGRPAWLMGLAMVSAGAVLSAVTFVLGG